MKKEVIEMIIVPLKSLKEKKKIEKESHVPLHMLFNRIKIIALRWETIAIIILKFQKV